MQYKCAVDVANTIEPIEPDNTLGRDAVNWLEHILRVGGKGGVYNVGTVAYGIVTAYQETQNFTKLVESDEQAKALGYYPWGGTGFVHLTLESNYKAMGERLGLDLINNRLLAARPDIAAQILFSFISDKPGTGQKIDQKLLAAPNPDFAAQRHIVNRDVNKSVSRAPGYPKITVGQRFQNVGTALIKVLYDCIQY